MLPCMGPPSSDSASLPHVRPLKEMEIKPFTRPGTRWSAPALAGCQVQTPPELVDFVWELIGERRDVIGKVVDLGAGDGRFATAGTFDEYIGYEIDESKHPESLPYSDAKVRHECVLNAEDGFDVAIGNPPYIRNQDIDPSWRAAATGTILDETGVRVHGLANLYVYFLWLALLRTKPDGLVSLVVPYEWVARPAAAHLREYLQEQRWGVSVYELEGEESFFQDVKTTVSVSVIDKSGTTGRFSYYRVTDTFRIEDQCGPGGKDQLFPYAERHDKLFARRGYSLGSQDVFALTEEERRNADISPQDVVPCVTSLRGIDLEEGRLDDEAFQSSFVSQNRKCWILDMSGGELSSEVQRWLGNAPDAIKENTTCSPREPWYKYAMPAVPDIVYSVGFTGNRPPFIQNEIGARTLGGVHGIYVGEETVSVDVLLKFLRGIDYSAGVVPYSRGLRKIGVGQMNGILRRFFK